jgi:hypothetical protein
MRSALQGLCERELRIAEEISRMVNLGFQNNAGPDRDWELNS